MAASGGHWQKGTFKAAKGKGGSMVGKPEILKAAALPYNVRKDYVALLRTRDGFLKDLKDPKLSPSVRDAFKQGLRGVKKDIAAIENEYFG